MEWQHIFNEYQTLLIALSLQVTNPFVIIDLDMSRDLVNWLAELTILSKTILGCTLPTG